MDLKTFYQECVKRKVFKGISIYAISSWLIIQVAATTFPYLGFPAEAVTTVIILVLICLPVSILFSWYYNVVPEPEDEEITDKPSLTKKQKDTNRIFFVVISLITILMLVVIFMVSRKNFNPSDSVVPVLSELASDQIAILQFSNNSTNKELDIVGKMVADWIAHGIIEYEIAPVMNYESINQFAAMGSGGILEANLSALSNVSSFSQLIRGAYFLNGDELIFQSEIIDRASGDQVALPQIHYKIDKKLEGVEKIKQQILSYFLGPKEILSDKYIPLYDAYEQYIIAKDYWRSERIEVSDEYLDNALKIDSNFYQAAYLKTILYYRFRLYEQADSLVSIYSKRFQGRDLAIEYFNYIKLLIDGRYEEGVMKFKKLFRNQPTDLYENGGMMVYNYNFINNSTDNEEIYNLINEEEIDYEQCEFCADRTRIMVLSYLDLGIVEKAVTLVDSHPFLFGNHKFAEAIIKTYVNADRQDALDTYFDSRSFKLLPENRKAYLFYMAAREYSLIGNLNDRNKYADQALEYYTQQNRFLMQGRCSYLKEDYGAAMESFDARNEEEKAKSEGKGHDFSLSRIAAFNMMQGKTEEANQIIKEIRLNKQAYDYGRAEYLIAHIYAMAGNADLTFQMLEQSLLYGRRYGILNFQNDPYLKEYIDDPRFKKLLTYWHK